MTAAILDRAVQGTARLSGPSLEEELLWLLAGHGGACLVCGEPVELAGGRVACGACGSVLGPPARAGSGEQLHLT